MSTLKPLRVVFMGTPEFAIPSLQALLDSRHHVAAVVTQPDRPKGRGRKLTAPPVKELALQAGLPVLQPAAIRTAEFLEELRSYRADLFAVTAYGRILPGPLLNLPPFGTINVHGSLLPRYRGAAPVQWAILNGDAETGITIMRMDEGLDTGDILLPGVIPIAADDTAATLAVKLAGLGGRLLIEALDQLQRGELIPRPQDERAVSLAPPLSKEQGRIDWSAPAGSISCRIRGLDPWPTAYTFLDNKRLRLFGPKIVGSPETVEPGTVLRADREGLLIATGRDALLIKEVQLEGARRMEVEPFLQGRRLEPGTRLG
ncbi:MAG: methionyl-tRNA formyltransferase [Desulfurivibrionaceae bacterium]|nr:methionyl-tRNA formyltransferase [Desulfobulbales bacterium]MDT8334881.1 methionyl-tRNA formyltransferase [Desulfurivibrionaceae bacterium]